MLEFLFSKRRRHQRRCFPMKFAKILRTPFFHGTPPVAASKFPLNINRKLLLFPKIATTRFFLISFSSGLHIRFPYE